MHTTDLKSGDKLVTTGENVVDVIKVINTQKFQPTFNFEVADYHTYFVGTNKVLVHNSKCKFWTDKKGRKQAVVKLNSRKEMKDARPRPKPIKAGKKQVTSQKLNKKGMGNQTEKHKKGG